MDFLESMRISCTKLTRETTLALPEVKETNITEKLSCFCDWEN
jgi:hypothetical protein